MLGSILCLALLPAVLGVSKEAVPPGVAAAPPTTRYAALPMRNLPGDQAGMESILHALQASLEERGASFVPADELEGVLRTRRIRYTNSVSAEAADTLRRETGAEYILLGTLLAFDREPTPRISVALRLIEARTGQRAQSCIVSLRGEDFAGLLGIGRITDVDELVLEIAGRVLDMFTDEGAPRLDYLPDGPPRRSTPASSLSRFVREGFDPEVIERLGVLPLSNRTNRQEVGQIFSDILAHECFRSAGIQIVEQSELRAAMIRMRIRSVEGVDLALLAALGRDLNTRYFALGSIDTYAEEAFIRGERSPEIEAFVRIIDVQEGRMVAAAGVHRAGVDYERWLGLGIVRDPVSLTERVAGEILAAIGIGK